MKRQAVVILVVTLAASGSASADSSNPPRPKSKALAVSISLGATLIPVGIGGVLMASSSTGMYAGAVLIGAGAAFGPSLGRVYAHDNKPFSLLPLRLAGAGVGCAGYLVAVSEALDEYETNEGLLIVGLVGFFAGTATVITTAVIDIGRAPKAVERYNQPAVGAKWQLRPAYFATSQALGANLSIEF